MPLDVTWGATASKIAMSRLGYFASAIAPDDLSANLDESSSAIRAKWPCVGEYDSILPADQAWFDTATGVMAAMTLIAAAITSQNDGMTSFKTDQQQSVFVSAPSLDEQVKWQNELAEAISFISCIRASLTASAASYSMFTLTGRTRQRESNCRLDISGILPVGWGLLFGSPFVNNDAGVPLMPGVLITNDSAGTYYP
jgi:hypothetical protein